MADTSPRNSKRTLLWVIAAVVLVAGFIALRDCSGTVVEVRTAPVVHADLITPLSTNGKVEALEDFQAHAASAGMVKQVNVEVGSHVAAGDLLVRLDTSDVQHQIASARAGLQAAANTLTNMRRGGSEEERTANQNDLQTAQTQAAKALTALTAMQSLAATGAASSNEVSQARQRVSDAQARVAQLQARDSSRYSHGDFGAQQAQVAQSRAALSAATAQLAAVIVRAPFAGTVYDLSVSAHDYVQAGGVLLDMADLRHLQVRAYFDEPEIGKLMKGQAVKITWEARPNSVWHGHIDLPPTTIMNYGTRNVGECLITVDDADGQLLPNTNVTVTVTISQKFNVLTVPREALHTEGTQDFVYSVVDGKLQRRVVQVGNINLTRVEIVNGLTDHDTVVLNAVDASELHSGMKVRVEP